MAGRIPITIEIRPEDGPMAGRLCAPGQPDRSFASWLELMAALREVVERERPESQDEAPWGPEEGR